MAAVSERCERAAEATRGNLTGTFDALRQRLTPGRMVDEAVDYARDTAVADFCRNLARDVREHPLPLLLIGAGIAWAIVATSIRQRPAIDYSPDRLQRVRAAGLRDQSGPPYSEWQVTPLDTAAG